MLAFICMGFGTWSFTVLGVWGKLTFSYSLDFWDFTASVAPFFGHWAGVIALPAVLTHYLLALWVRPRGLLHNGNTKPGVDKALTQ